MKYRYQRLDDQHYAVSLGGVVLGEVYYKSDAWSDGRWFIVGEPPKVVYGGVNSKTKNLKGYYTRKRAAHKLAVMNSAKLIAA